MFGVIMKIEILEKSKIKVTLTMEDLIYYNLKPEKISARSPRLEKFIFNIMDNVLKETGFNPYKCPVAIEAVQSGEGMVLYISGLGEKAASSKDVIIKGEHKKIKVICKKEVCSKNSYCFLDFEELSRAVVNLSSESLLQSSLYEYDNKWYFVLGPSDDFQRSHCILSEHCNTFGGMIYSETFLSEHGRLIAKEKSLVTLSKGIKELEEK